MNTPAHAILNLLVLHRRGDGKHLGAITVGAVLPDAPMLIFYLWEKLALRTPETEIWNSKYFDPSWHTFFDLFNSLPLAALIFILALWRRSGTVQALTLSMGIHTLADLLTHREDAHRHFFPLSDWRFQSPVSYWDPAHHGQTFMLGEVLLTLVATILLAKRIRRPKGRWLSLTIAAIYLLFLTFAFLFWV